MKPSVRPTRHPSESWKKWWRRGTQWENHIGGLPGNHVKKRSVDLPSQAEQRQDQFPSLESTLSAIRESNETHGVFPQNSTHLHHDMTGFTPKNLTPLAIAQPNSTHSIPAMPNMTQAWLPHN